MFSSPILRGRNTKTGVNQSVSVRDKDMQALLSALLMQTSPGQPLFPFSYQVFARWFNAAAASLGLQAEHFTLHSLHLGGATHD